MNERDWWESQLRGGKLRHTPVTFARADPDKEESPIEPDAFGLPCRDALADPDIRLEVLSPLELEETREWIETVRHHLSDKRLGVRVARLGLLRVADALVASHWATPFWGAAAEFLAVLPHESVRYECMLCVHVASRQYAGEKGRQALDTLSTRLSRGRNEHEREDFYGEEWGRVVRDREMHLEHRKGALSGDAPPMVALATDYLHGAGVLRSMRAAQMWAGRALAVGASEKDIKEILASEDRTE